MAVIVPRLHEIIEMLLPMGYLPIHRQPRPASDATTSLDASKPASCMLGPACALLILSQNSKCYLYGDVGTDVMCYLRDTAGPYARDDRIRQFEIFVSIRNTRRRGRHVGVAHQDSKPK